jgi:hypothetical protein
VRVETPVRPVSQLTTDEQKMYKEGLCDLGKTFNNARHAFLTLQLPSKNLDEINGINKFRFLQNVYVSNNNLTNLECLSALKHLVRLDATHNRITKMLDFAPPACLDYVDYSHN